MSPNPGPRNRQDLRAMNRMAVLQALRRSGPLTRGELGGVVGLSASAVTNVVSKLLENGLLDESESPPHDAPRLGRPSAQLALRPEGGHVIGAIVELDRVEVGLVDLVGTVLSRTSAHISHRAGSLEVLQTVARLIADQRQSHPGINPIAAGVAVPGPVDDGIADLDFVFGWGRVAVVEQLQPALGLPVVLEQNAVAMAHAEWHFGAGRNDPSLSFVWVGPGVGAGIVREDDRTVTGIRGTAQLGHVPIIPNGPLCACGNHGCLQAVVAEPALTQAAHRLAGDSPLLRRLLAAQPPVDALMDAARGADASARAAIDEIVGWLGIGLASLINIADPGLVVLGGVLDRHADLFFPALEEATRSHVYPPLQSKLRVITTSFGADVGVVGAASIALDEVVFGTAQDPAASS